MSNFVNFAATSHYSIQRSTVERHEIIKRAKTYGQKKVCLSEKGSLFRWFNFIKQAKEEGLQPILGLQIKVLPIWPEMWRGKRYKGIFEHPEPQITLIAKNLSGLKNLMKISTLSMNRLSKFDPNRLPEISFEELEKYKWNLACLSGHFEGFPGSWINEDRNIGEAQLIRLHEVFKDDLYLELQDHTEVDEEWSIDGAINSWYEELALKHGIKLIATNSVFYFNPADAHKLEILDAIRRKMQALNGTGKSPTSGFYAKGEKDFEKSDFPEEAMNNIYSLAAEIEDYGFDQKNIIVPIHRTAPDKYTHPELSYMKLEMLCRDGMKRLNLDGIQVYEDRLKEELDMIKNKEFSSYFLVVGDIMNWMRDRNIITPTGRGSAAGSLVCYLLDITSIDPITNDLPFWRFISSARKDMPDIDSDVPNKERKNILNFIRDTYGAKRVGQIATFVTMQPKNAIENVGRVYDVPRPVRDEARAFIPFNQKVLDDDFLNSNPRFKELMDLTPGWWETASFLCGKCNNIGYHPAAIVISNDPLEDCSALMPEHEGYHAVQLDMHDAEDVGLLKLDMLGLRTLDQIQETFQQIEVNYGEKLTMQTIPTNDTDVFSYYATGNYLDVFQSSKGGFRRFIKNLKPETIEHISAAVALYRPGPLEAGFTDSYCDRKNGKEDMTSLHPAMDPFLKDTYNLIVYQEQMMQFSMAVGGLNDAEADKFRKAIGKKDKVAYDALSDKILQGALSKGENEKEMRELLGKMADFARYAFNRAHSASYGMNAYVTAYLEYYYPLEYAAATLNAYIDKMDDRKRLVEGAIRMGIRIVKPDVNKSDELYRADPVDKVVYIGLRGVEGLNKAADKIVEERRKNGEYKSYIDFMRRLPSVSKKVVENLIKVGAFSWDDSVSDIDKLDNIDILRKTLKKKTKSVDGSKLTDEEVLNFPGNEASLEHKWFSPMQMSENEHRLLGFFTTEHPASVYTKLGNKIFVGSTKLYTPTDIVQGPAHPGEGAFVICKVDNVIIRETKSGKPYLMVSVSDQFNKLFFNIWSPECDEFRGILKEDMMMCLSVEVVHDKFYNNTGIKLKRAFSLDNGVTSRQFIADDKSDRDEIIRRIQKYCNADTEGEPKDMVGQTIYTLDRRINLLPSLIKEFCEGTSIKIIPLWN